MILFSIFYTFVTFFLLLSIIGSIAAYRISVNTNLILSIIIGFGATILCFILAIHSIFSYFIYGAAISFFLAYLTIITKSPKLNGFISCLFGLFFWPQLLCFAIFTNIYAQDFLDPK